LILRDGKGKTAIQRATEKGYVEIAKVLQEKQGRAEMHWSGKVQHEHEHH
jgi:hypothetical protein